ncbi:MAG: hypothetical protein H5U02_13010 [Clostridia bacterium]|nr:hypothetical protein [Clostridia bacterium]
MSRRLLDVIAIALVGGVILFFTFGMERPALYHDQTNGVFRLASKQVLLEFKLIDATKFEPNPSITPDSIWLTKDWKLELKITNRLDNKPIEFPLGAATVVSQTGKAYASQSHSGEVLTGGQLGAEATGLGTVPEWARTTIPEATGPSSLDGLLRQLASPQPGSALTSSQPDSTLVIPPQGQAIAKALFVLPANEAPKLLLLPLPGLKEPYQVRLD